MYLYLTLFAAIAFEVTGTMLLPATHNFTKVLPTTILLASYALSFYFLALVSQKLFRHFSELILSLVSIANSHSILLLPELIIERLRTTKSYKPGYGYNASTEKYGCMRKMKVVDPHLVVESSLKHALSVATNILTVGCSIVITEENVEDFGLIEKI